MVLRSLLYFQIGQEQILKNTICHTRLFFAFSDVRHRGGSHSNGDVRRRSSTVSDAENAKAPTTDSTQLIFKVKPLKNVQTDFQ